VTLLGIELRRRILGVGVKKDGAVSIWCLSLPFLYTEMCCDASKDDLNGSRYNIRKESEALGPRRLRLTLTPATKFGQRPLSFLSRHERVQKYTILSPVYWEINFQSISVDLSRYWKPLCVLMIVSRQYRKSGKNNRVTARIVFRLSDHTSDCLSPMW
jgi:hypothetical protein